MTILNIRGTHGSGKSWVIHQLLKLPYTFLVDEDQKPLGYRLIKQDVAIVGKYANQCGGCDGIKAAEEVVRRVRMFAASYRHVIFEGILVSHIYQRYANLAKELAEHDFRFLFLNTPLKVCIRRVEQRRKEQGNYKPLNPTNVIKDWHRVGTRVRNKCLADGLTVVDLNWRDPLPQIMALLAP